MTLTFVPALNSTSFSVGLAEYPLMSLPRLPLITNRVFLSRNPMPVDALENAAQVRMLPGR